MSGKLTFSTYVDSGFPTLAWFSFLLGAGDNSKVNSRYSIARGCPCVFRSDATVFLIMAPKRQCFW